MNVVREINKINEAELRSGTSASWHDEYKDSAYIYVGGLHYELTEGDVITIFSQYGEVMDINLPRDKETGKTRGFGFLMYEDQRSTILAVDNLNGAVVLEKTLRVDHVKNYKQAKTKGADGEWIEPEDQSLNAKPEMIMDTNAASDSSEDSGSEIDPEDPMYEYLMGKRREEKALKKSKKSRSKKSKHRDETAEEKKARRALKKEKKEKKAKKAGHSQGVKGVEDLLASLGGREARRPRSRTSEGSRYRSRSLTKNRDARDHSSRRTVSPINRGDRDAYRSRDIHMDTDKNRQRSPGRSRTRDMY